MDGTFRIAQFTDLHLDPTSPGKAQTLDILREIIGREQPDLVILTGDVVTRAPAAGVAEYHTLLYRRASALCRRAW